MNAREQDIERLIKFYGPLTSAQLQYHLTSPRYGYNLEVEQISKIASKMKSNGLLTGEDRPNPGTKPVRYWGLPEPVVNDQMTTEMDSNIAEVEQGEWSDAKTFEAAPECTEWKQLLPSKPMSVSKALDVFAETGLIEQFQSSFLEGIAAAERFHGIAE